MTTFAGKKAKLFFYTPRELLLMKDGTFCYKKKNRSNEIKLAMKPDDIQKIQLQKRYLTVTLKD